MADRGAGASTKKDSAPAEPGIDAAVEHTAELAAGGARVRYVEIEIEGNAIEVSTVLGTLLAHLARRDEHDSDRDLKSGSDGK